MSHLLKVGDTVMVIPLTAGLPSRNVEVSEIRLIGTKGEETIMDYLPWEEVKGRWVIIYWGGIHYAYGFQVLPPASGSILTKEDQEVLAALYQELDQKQHKEGQRYAHADFMALQNPYDA